MRQVFALEPDVCAPALAQARHCGQRRRPPGPRLQLARQCGLELRRRQDVLDAVHEPLDGRHQRFGHVTAAERAEAAVLVGQLSREQIREKRLSFLRFHGHTPIARTRATNSRILSGSFSPRARSTPLETSTPQGRTKFTASWTFAAVKPPARITSATRARPAASSQSATRPLPLCVPSNNSRSGKSESAGALLSR